MQIIFLPKILYLLQYVETLFNSIIIHQQIVFNQTFYRRYKQTQEGFLMIIQSKKVWLADQFFAAAIEMEDGKIVNVLPLLTSL